MDFRIRQTSTASPAEPGELLCWFSAQPCAFRGCGLRIAAHARLELEMQLWASRHHDVRLRPRIMTICSSAIVVAGHDVTFLYDCSALDAARPSGSSLESRDLRLCGEEQTHTPPPREYFSLRKNPAAKRSR